MTTQTQTAITKRSTTETLSDLLRARKDSIAQLVPKHLTPERLMRVAVNCVSKTPKLQECTPTSLLQSVLVAAELGLEPGGALGHLYLVPYKDQCTAIIGYRGLIELARRSGEIASIRAVVVHEKDSFRLVEGIDQTIEHEPFLDGDPGRLRLVYCVVKLKDGGVHVELMTRAQVDGIKARSRSRDNGPWVTDYEEMAKKTVAKRALKWQPISSERLRDGLERDEDVLEETEDKQLSESVAAAVIATKEKVRRLVVGKSEAPPPPEVPHGAVTGEVTP